MSASAPRRSLAGLVLAGGRSSRFGGPKAAALLQGRSLLTIAAEALASVCDEVAVSAPADSAAARLAGERGLTVITDRPGDAAGPLAGISAGLHWAQARGHDHLAVRAVDTPLLTGGVHAALWRAIGDARAAYAVTAEGPQPLCAVWTLAAAAPLLQALAGGRHPSVRGFLDALGAVRLMAEDAEAFLNINTPQDLDAAASVAMAGAAP